MENQENKSKDIKGNEKEEITIKKENISQKKTSNNVTQKRKKKINNDLSTFSIVVLVVVFVLVILACIGALLHFKEYINIVGNTYPVNLVKGSFNIFKQNIYVCLSVICFIGIIYIFSEKSKAFIKNSLIFILGILFFIYFPIYIFIGLGLLFHIL